ncbi:hypothetical protein LLG10_06015 [bacterium]|nr:hypothetical protein [bacterium]
MPGNIEQYLIPKSIALSVSISIIVIAIAILIWLIITIVFGMVLLKKMNLFTKNLNTMVTTLNDKTKLIGDSTSQLLQSYRLPERKESEKTSSFSKFAYGFGSIFAVIFEVTQLVKKFKGGKKQNG